MKKITIFILAVLMAVACISTALAANWVEIGRDNDRINFVDASSFKRTGSSFRIREKTILRSSQARAECKRVFNLSKTPVYITDWWEYKINKPIARTIEGEEIYAKDGTVLMSLAPHGEWHPISETNRIWLFGRKKLGLK